MKNQHLQSKHKTQKIKTVVLAVSSVLSALSYSQAIAGASCASDASGNVNCANSTIPANNSANSIIFNANQAGANSSFIGSTLSVDGKTVTIQNGAVINGDNVNFDGTTSGTPKNKVGIYIYNGQESVNNPDYDASLLGGLVEDKSFNNVGTKIINRGSIAISSTTSGANSSFGTAGILLSGSNNTIDNFGSINLTATPTSSNLKQWGILIDNSAYETTGTNYNNLNNTVNNFGSIAVSNILTSGDLASSAYATGVTFKEAVIDQVLNNYGNITVNAGTSTKYAFGVYSDDNAGSVTVNNYGTINVNGGGFTAGTATSNNAAVFLRAFSANLNNFENGVLNGNVMTRSTTSGFGLYNAGQINGSFVRYLGGADADAIYTDSDGNWDRHFKDTYQPVITANGISSISGNFILKQENTSNTNSFTSDLWIKPTLSGAVVRNGDGPFALLGNGSTFKFLTSAGVAYNGSNTNLLTYKLNDVTVSDLTTQVFTYNTALVHWDISLNNNGSIQATVHDAKSIDGITNAAAKTLNHLMTFNSDLGAGVQNEVDPEKVRKLGEQLKPEVNGAKFQSAMVMNNKMLDLVNVRLDQVHLASLTGRTGIATGDQGAGTGFWLQGYGGKGDQDRRKDIDGYSLDTTGFALGADRLVNDDLRLGVAGSYGRSNIDYKGDIASNRTDMNSYQAMLYASRLMDSWYLNGLLSVGKHDYSDKRYVLDGTIKGNYSSWQYSAKLEAGLPVKLGSVNFIPLASLAYSYLNEDSYHESGLGALSVKSRSTDSLRSGLGAKLYVPLSDSQLKTGIELRGIWQHEFANTAQNTNARFIDGGGTFSVRGISPERDSANLGASLKMFGASDGVKQTLSVNYDAEVKSQYVNQTASLQARFDF